MLSRYFTEKKKYSKSYWWPLRAGNKVSKLCLVLRTGQTFSSTVFSAVIFHCVKTNSHAHPPETVTPAEIRRTTSSSNWTHGEAEGCRLQLSRSPGNNKQPTVNSFRLWTDHLSVALAHSCRKWEEKAAKTKPFTLKHKQMNKLVRLFLELQLRWSKSILQSSGQKSGVVFLIILKDMMSHKIK